MAAGGGGGSKRRNNITVGLHVLYMGKEKDLLLFAKTLHLFSALWLHSLFCGSEFPGNSQDLLKSNSKMRKMDNWRGVGALF